MRIAGTMYSRIATMIARKLRSLSGSARAANLDDIFGGIHALITCGFFSGLNISATDRERHVQGLENMTRSISNAQMSTAIRDAFRHKWGRQGFWLAIKQRKDLSRVDCRVEFADCWRITDSEDLSRLASLVPGLLERADAFLTRPRSRQISQRDVVAILTELEASVDGLKKWQLMWESAVPPPYHLKSIRSFEDFQGLSGQYFEVFKTAYSFATPANERDFRVLQICLLSLDLTITQLHRALRRFVIEEEFKIQARRAEFGAELAVEALCM